MRRYILGVLALGLSVNTFAQKGIGTLLPSKATALHLFANHKGLFIPRVALTALNSFSPLSGETEPTKRNALWVYNTATVPGELSPGYYYWTQSTPSDGKWNRMLGNNDTYTLAGAVQGSILNNSFTAGAVNSSHILNESITNTHFANAAQLAVSKFQPGAANQTLGSGGSGATWMDSYTPIFTTNSGNVYQNLNSDFIKPFVIGGPSGSRSDAGTKMVFLFNGNNSYFRAGTFTADNLANTGTYFTIAMGHEITASGEGALALGGSQNSAIGNSSLAMGIGNTAPSAFETSLGAFGSTYTLSANGNNTWNTTDRLFSIGNGTNASTRSNALTVLKNGNVGLGTDAPTAALDVIGQIKINGGNPGANRILISDATGLARWVNPPRFKVFLTGADEIYLGNADDRNKDFIYNGSTGSAFTNNESKFVFYPNRGGSFRIGRTFDSFGIAAVGMGTNVSSSVADSATMIAVSGRATGKFSTVFGGWANETSGKISTTLAGSGNVARSYLETAIGNGNVAYTPAGGANNWNDNDRLFVAGGNSANQMLLLKNGNMSIAGTLTENSDRRLKQNIHTIANGLNTIQKLRPVQYDKKVRLSDTQYPYHDIGFIAQEVEKELPLLVTTSKDTDQIKSVNYLGVVPVLTKAIQEQNQLWKDDVAQKAKALAQLEQENEKLRLELQKLKEQKQAFEARKLALMEKFN